MIRDFGNMPTVPCQKSIIDRLMTFAFPYIKAVPNVRLVGGVTRSTEQHWEYIIEGKLTTQIQKQC
jgi:hypothetical protein